MDTAPGRSGPAMTSASPAAAAASSLIRRALGLCRMLRGWPGEVLDQLAAVSWVGRYQRHEQIMADDPQRREVLVVASGCIAVDHIDASGQHFLLSMYGPGDITSLIRLLTDAPFHFGFHAREPSTVVHLPCDAMMTVLDAHPILWKDLCLLMLARTHQSILLQQQRSSGQVTQMVADSVVQLARARGQDGAARARGGVQVSQTELAAMLSVSRQTINKVLQALCQAGLLRVHYGRLEGINLGRLERVARGEPEPH